MTTKHDSQSLIKAADNEPIFVLRAQDMLTPALVRLWADLAAMHGCPAAKIEEARQLADQMEAWPARKYPD
jgi:hypothetical protein